MRVVHSPAVDTAWFKARKRELGINDQVLAEAIGRDRTTVTKVINGGIRFDLAFLQPFADALQVSSDELLRRVGISIPERATTEALPPPLAAPRSEHQPIRPAAGDDTVEIIALDLSLSMGPGTLIEEFAEAEPIRMSVGFVQAITRTPSDRLRLVKGIGDSMEPTLRAGDRVMIDINEKQLSRSHGVYWIDHLGTHGIKRLRAAGRGKIMVMSDNPNVPDFEVDAADLRIEGRVIWFARDL
ncbi:XRE family transcriptional regulator [Sphingomonas desiccabilis]|uniref:XRE family transcriptional regulator n=1 Tax=Sphingomonas desiccabilis TaxID=429134 RepID=UPI0013ED6F3E|nr:S24 family peptidase [Sphingomonas desiccabilis]